MDDKDKKIKLLENRLERSKRSQQEAESLLEDLSLKLYKTNENLKKNKDNLSKAQQLAKLGSWSLDLQKNLLLWSDEVFNLFEIDPEAFDASYEAFINAIHPDDRKMVDDAYSNSLITKQPYKIDHRLKFPDGRIKYVREICESTFDDEGTPLQSSGTVQDITSEVISNERIRLYANVLQQSSEAILITDSQNLIVTINQSLTDLTGYTEEELIGKNPNILSSGNTAPEVYDEMWKSINSTGQWQGELLDKKKDGTIYPKWISITAIKDQRGDISNYIGVFKDISERKAYEEKVQFLAHNDHLTGLYNRYSLEERLGQAISHAKRNTKKVAVLFIDMDRFKKINDSLGHQAGDAVIKQVSKRLKLTIRRESDVIARIGGDEFVVVLDEIEDSKAAALICMTAIHVLSQPYQYQNQDIHSAASIGLSMYPTDGTTSSELFKNADFAMYHAKQKGGNNFQFFNASMNEETKESIELENDLRKAISNNELELHYQPKIMAEGNEVYGVEALLRWKHPKKGYIPPIKFIEIAEKSAQIRDIGKWVTHQACIDLADLRNNNFKNIQIGINVSIDQLMSDEFINDIEHYLNHYALPPHLIDIEITESIAMDDPENTIKKLHLLKQIGTTISVDDFGTGYSSLSYLKLLPVDTLKIDRCFVHNIEIDKSDQAICDATISLAHSLDMTVVAEGVETKKQKDYLTSKGCDYLQGYLISKPLPKSLLIDFLKNNY